MEKRACTREEKLVFNNSKIEMKRVHVDNDKQSNKRVFRRPTTISVGSSNADDTQRYLGAKTRGTIEFAEKQPAQKKPFGKYEHGNYQGYYT